MKIRDLNRVLVVLCVLLYAESAQALSLWDDRVQFNGYLKAQFGRGSETSTNMEWGVTT